MVAVRLLISLLCLAFLAPAAAQAFGHANPGRADRLLRARLDHLSRHGALRFGTTAIHIVDAEHGRVVYTQRADALLNPASNVKLIATAAALQVLGPSWRYRTYLIGSRPDAQGVVKGPVALIGNGDPSLGQKQLEALVEAYVHAGARRIHGDILLGSGVRIARPTAQRLRLQITARRRPGGPPRVEVTPASPFLQLRVSAITGEGKAKALRVAAADGQGTVGRWLKITVAGRLPAGDQVTNRITVRHAGLATAFGLSAALAKVGLRVRGTIRPGTPSLIPFSVATVRPVVLLRHRSPDVASLVARINKQSDNHLADRLVATAGARALGGKPTVKKGVRIMVRWLRRVARIDTRRVRLDTGSGLSYRTRLSARHIVRVLRTAAGFRSHGRPQSPAEQRRQAAITEAFRASLAVAGQDGTLHFRFRRSSARKRFAGKSGTLRRIIALSGFLRLDRGRTLCLSIVSNGIRRRDRLAVRRQHERLVEALVRHYHHPSS